MRFNASEHRCSIIIDEKLSRGLAINAASVIGVGLGCNVDNLVGKDFKSLDGVNYPGVIYSPLPLLSSTQKHIDEIFSIVKNDSEIHIMPFSSLAQSCKTYVEYGNKMSSTSSEEIQLVAIGLVGPKKKITKLVGSLPLYK